jgi:hypothetical protein
VLLLSLDAAGAHQDVSWEEWILRPYEAGGEDGDDDYNERNLKFLEELVRKGIVVFERGQEDPERQRYLEQYVPSDVLTSMRGWDHEGADLPRLVSDAGMSWLQRLLVNRDTARRLPITVGGYGPLGLNGLLAALGVVCYDCSPRVSETLRVRVGNAFVTRYTRQLRRSYEEAKAAAGATGGLKAAGSVPG